MQGRLCDEETDCTWHDRLERNLWREMHQSDFLRADGTSAGLTLHDPLESLRLFLRHRVPEFGRAKVDVVDRVQICVLNVPGERRAPHAEIEIGRYDTRYFAVCWRETRKQVP